MVNFKVNFFGFLVAGKGGGRGGGGPGEGGRGSRGGEGTPL